MGRGGRGSGRGEAGGDGEKGFSILPGEGAELGGVADDGAGGVGEGKQEYRQIEASLEYSEEGDIGGGEEGGVEEESADDGAVSGEDGGGGVEGGDGFEVEVAEFEGGGERFGPSEPYRPEEHDDALRRVEGGK